MNLAVIGRNSDWSRESFLALTATLVLTTVFVILVSLSSGKPVAIAVFPLLAILLFILSSFELALAALVISLFVDYHISLFSSAVWFSLPFGLAFLVKHRSIEWKEFANPMTIPMLVYGACILPSFLNATKPLLSLVMLFNVAAFLIVLYALVAALRTHDDLRRVVTVFLVMLLLNSIHVFIQSFMGVRRPFGFAGIMFVDYSALGVCVAIALAFISNGKKRLLFLLLSFIMAVALILTLTRNAWLSTLITLLFLLGYLIVHANVVGFSRRRAVLVAAVGLLLIAGGITTVVSLDPRIGKRATEFVEKQEYGIDPWGGVETSLIARLLIWDTALNAFRAHPYVGIGVYGFSYSSHLYSDISQILYRRYVAGNSPHQTHLAVLTETGVIGALGFAVFLFAIIWYSFKTIRQVKEDQAKKYAFVGTVAVVYCLVSMVLTDAWLWGQGIVLLGVVIGLVLANRRLGISTDGQVMG